MVLHPLLLKKVISVVPEDIPVILPVLSISAIAVFAEVQGVVASGDNDNVELVSVVLPSLHKEVVPVTTALSFTVIVVSREHPCNDLKDIFVVPAFFPSMLPVLSMVATVTSEDVHGFVASGVAVTVSCSLSLTQIVKSPVTLEISGLDCGVTVFSRVVVQLEPETEMISHW